MVCFLWYAFDRMIIVTFLVNKTLDQTAKVLINLPMFVGAFTACILDNTVPGKIKIILTKK